MQHKSKQEKLFTITIEEQFPSIHLSSHPNNFRSNINMIYVFWSVFRLHFQVIKFKIIVFDNYLNRF